MPVLTQVLQPVTIFAIDGEEAATKRRLIDAGERLMGIHGIDGPSLQDIAAEAGQANKFAVQYHFLSREGLVEAIFAIRMRSIAARRQQLLERAEELGLANDLAALIESVFIPMSEQVDASGRHSYARMLLQYTSRIGFDPQRADDPFNARRGHVVAVMARMAMILSMDFASFELSFFQQNVAMIVGLAARDNLTHRGQVPPPLEWLLDHTVAMAEPALRAAARFVRDHPVPTVSFDRAIPAS